MKDLREFFDKGKIIENLYVGELFSAATSRTVREIKFMAREEGNGSILMSKQVGLMLVFTRFLDFVAATCSRLETSNE